MLLAAGLRFAGITFDSFWLDEAYQSLADATGQKLPDFINPANQPYLFTFDPPHPISEVLSNFRLVDPLCPPLYAVLLNYWMTFLGGSDLAIRSLSTVLSLASLCLLFWLTQTVFGNRTAIIVTLLQAVSPFDIYYAQEARSYTLTVFASLVSSGALFLTVQGNRSRLTTTALLTAYVLGTWALINSHYTGLFTVFFQFVWSSYMCFKRKALPLYCCLLLSWAGVLLLWLPWLDMFAQAASIRTESFYVARKPSWWWPVWAAAVRVPLNWIVFLSGKKVVAYVAPLYLTASAFLALAVTATFPSLRGRFSFLRTTGANVSFFWLWAIIPAGIVWLADVLEGHRVIEISRYLIATAPAIYILAGYGLSSILSSTWSRYLLIAHVALALANNAYAHAVPQREPWSTLAQKVESLVSPNDLILVSQYYNIACLDRYLTRPLRQVGVTPQLGANHLEKVLSNCHQFWLITAQEGEAIKEMLPKRFTLIQQEDFPHALHLRLYKER
ncbi:MAG: glycosyltransferase family 39 protein [Candidatus Melainabacteria bacterium]|nr:glycosyltransferase family 39 protein [Candidatus Melainabacteria bacterium]